MSSNFVSCKYFMPCTLVRQFHVLIFWRSVIFIQPDTRSAARPSPKVRNKSKTNSCNCWSKYQCDRRRLCEWVMAWELDGRELVTAAYVRCSPYSLRRLVLSWLLGWRSVYVALFIVVADDLELPCRGADQLAQRRRKHQRHRSCERCPQRQPHIRKRCSKKFKLRIPQLIYMFLIVLYSPSK